MADGNAALRDSIDRTRDALRRGEPPAGEPGPTAPTGDAARREAVRSAVASFRAGVDSEEGLPVQSLHPFFRGLLDTLPPPGEEWPQAKREQWLETARNIFALLYIDNADTPRATLRLVRSETEAVAPASPEPPYGSLQQRSA